MVLARVTVVLGLGLNLGLGLCLYSDPFPTDPFHNYSFLWNGLCASLNVPLRRSILNSLVSW